MQYQIMERLLNIYSKYPWVAIILVAQWVYTAFILITQKGVDVTTVMGIAFFSTIIYSYFGFKVPK